MAHAADTMPNTGLVIDRESHTIRLTRSFDASCAEVFDAWTKPEHVKHWWDAAGGVLTQCEIDLRPGGAFKFVTKSHPEMPFTGTYGEVEPPHRLVFGTMGSTGRVILKDVGRQTEMTVEIQCQSAEQLDQFLKMGIDAGTAQTLDNLVAYMQGRSAARC